MPEESLQLWTASLDYFATGEGRTIMARICYATTEEDARRQFGEEFDAYYAHGCTIERGVVRNDVTLLLWSGQALDLFEKIDTRGNLKASSMLHYNFS